MTTYRSTDHLVDVAETVQREHVLLALPSKWAEYRQQIVFPAGEPIEGPLDLDRFPPQQEIMDAMGVLDPCSQVTIMKSAQIGGTMCYLIPIGQRLDEFPSRAMIVIAKRDNTAKYHSGKWSTFVEASARLRAKVGLPGYLDNMALTEVPGGSLAICGGKIPDTFRETPYEFVVLDDLDAIPPNPEGDHVTLAARRTTMFRMKSPKVVAVSSPVDVDGPIHRQWKMSSQERWYVPCLQCGKMQVLELDPMLCWTPGQPATAHFVCSGDGCGHKIRQYEIKAMNTRGEWRALYPERKPVHRGFHLSQAFAPLEFASWAEYVRTYEKGEAEFEEKGSEETRRVARNTMAGLPYESVSGAKIDEVAAATRARCEQPFAVKDLPIMLRTIGCDLGSHGITCQLVGHGPAEERWILDYRNFDGNVRYDALWSKWCDWIIEQRPEAVCVDASWEQDLVCSHLLTLSVRLHDAGIYVWPVKGQEGHKRLWPEAVGWGNLKNMKPYPVSVGVDAAKSAIYDSLATERRSGEGVFHFTVDRGKQYFRQLFSERRVEPGDKVGKRQLFIPRSTRIRGEALDTLVYALAAADGYIAVTEAMGAHGMRAALLGRKPTTEHGAPARPQPPPIPRQDSAPSPFSGESLF